MCQLLNLTSRTQVRQLLDGLFQRWPSALAMGEADPEELANYIRPLGLATQRAGRLIEMSRQYDVYETMYGKVTPGSVQELHGCGQYAEDAVRIFCEDDLTVESDDRVLLKYVQGERKRRNV